MRPKSKPNRINTTIRIDERYYELLEKHKGKMSDIINETLAVINGETKLKCPQCKCIASAGAMGVKI